MTSPLTRSSGNPRTYGPNDPGSPEHPNEDVECSLVESLGGIVDDIRQLATDLGARPYRVFSVVSQWSGGEIGRGEVQLLRETEFLPTPKLVETSGVRAEPKSGGIAERGTIKLREVSPRYTEDEVRGLLGTGPLTDPATGIPLAAVEVFVEVRMDPRDGVSERRRFIVSGMPYRDGEAFEWVVSLLRQDQDRTRGGALYPYEGR